MRTMGGGIDGPGAARRLWSPPARFTDRPTDRRVTFLELFFDLVTPSLIERLGLFVIIVLGEVIVGAVNGMAGLNPISVIGIEIGLLGVLVAIGLWWIYFDLMSNHAPVPRRTQLWLYLHLPLVTAMAGVGAGVLNAVERSTEPLPADVRWLLVGALAVAVGSVAALTRTLEIGRTYPALYRTVAGTLAGSAALILAVGLTDWGAKGTLGAMVLLLGLPIATGIAVWLRRTDAADLTLHP